ncbi:helix-turn-helix domain-containing protein, partial [Desulfovibrio sp. OttesenSCG-928-C06]|nr:helix-turn-helix domain-containing protein [Desulfovibrio sp. OttesenSCG-928-C06]
MTLAQKIQKHRKMRGMTQEELAEALNVSHQSISKWESAQATPGIDKILLLSEYFKISTDALLKEGTESAPVPPHLPTPAPLPASTSLPADAPPASVAKAPADPDRQKPKWLFILGLTVSVAGLLGLGALWFMSLLYPPYTFDKPLGPV